MRMALASFAVVMAVGFSAVAQTGTPTGPGAAAAARPTRGPEQSSVPSAAPSANLDHTTVAKDQNPVVKQMNESERKKVEVHGK